MKDSMPTWAGGWLKLESDRDLSVTWTEPDEINRAEGRWAVASVRWASPAGATGQAGYLEDGEKALAELSMYQSVWNPAYMAFPRWAASAS
ncbi:hypothetical protein ABD76_21815 [Paenibacillus dendritiformis]|nr:hypothetical protein [Paenibacillus dendritiformis]